MVGDALQDVVQIVLTVKLSMAKQSVFHAQHHCNNKQKHKEMVNAYNAQNIVMPVQQDKNCIIFISVEMII